MGNVQLKLVEQPTAQQKEQPTEQPTTQKEQPTEQPTKQKEQPAAQEGAPSNQHPPTQGLDLVQLVELLVAADGGPRALLVAAAMKDPKSKTVIAGDKGQHVTGKQFCQLLDPESVFKVVQGKYAMSNNYQEDYRQFVIKYGLWQ